MTAQTSFDAWRSLDGLAAAQAAVLQVLAEVGPCTDEHLVAVYRSEPDMPRQSPSGIRTRRSELVRAGLVVDSGGRDQTISGRWAVAWTVNLSPVLDNARIMRKDVVTHTTEGGS